MNQPNNNKLHWEDIEHDNGFYLRRAKVFGGWLVNTIYESQEWSSAASQYADKLSGSLAFVPDPHHSWQLAEPEKPKQEVVERDWQIESFITPYFGQNDVVFNRREDGLFQPDVKYNWGTRTQKVLLDVGAKIHSVKRLSDGTTWTVGEETVKDTIERFELPKYAENPMYVWYKGGGYDYLHECKKLPPQSKQEPESSEWRGDFEWETAERIIFTPNPNGKYLIQKYPEPKPAQQQPEMTRLKTWMGPPHHTENYEWEKKVDPERIEVGLAYTNDRKCYALNCSHEIPEGKFDSIKRVIEDVLNGDFDSVFAAWKKQLNEEREKAFLAARQAKDGSHYVGSWDHHKFPTVQDYLTSLNK